MKRTALESMSNKKRKVLAEEARKVKLLLEQCKGRCMLCWKKPDFRGLCKNHTKDRKDFVLSCYPCHTPDGRHKYLNEVEKDEDIKYLWARILAL